ncbi:MAG: hypothetical protein ABWY55_08840 [Microbacterium sp.]
MTNAFDLQGDGYSETLGEDLNGDGAIDAVMQDTNLDGTVDSYAWDANYDGVIDTAATDSNQDGYIEAAGWDTNGDGVLDTLAADANGDGALEIVQQPGVYDPYSMGSTVGGTRYNDGLTNLIVAIAEQTGQVAWGSGDYDSDGIIDSRDYHPEDRTRG